VRRQGFLITFPLAGLPGVQGFLSRAHAQTPAPVVRAVLFYSPICPHCQYAIAETLSPLMSKYGNELQIIGVDVTHLDGQMLFLPALQRTKLQQGGIPFLMIGSICLVESQEIPGKLPAVVEAYLSQGGVDWPDIPRLREAISQSSNAGTQQRPLPLNLSRVTSGLYLPRHLSPPAATRGCIPLHAQTEPSGDLDHLAYANSGRHSRPDASASLN
jgi:thiol-disulfide isomerase/thioredoxin